MGAVIQPAAVFPGLADSMAALLLGAVVLIAVLSVVIYRGIESRRRREGDVREIVRSIERVRAGESAAISLPSDSPLAGVADALERLDEDLAARLKTTSDSSERTQAVVEAVEGNALVSTDIDGDIRSFSAGAAELLGWEVGEVLSRPASILFEEGSYKEFLPKLARRSLREQGVNSRARLVRKDGETFSAELSVRLLRGADRGPIGFVIAIHEVTEQLRLESELRESEERYRRLVERLVEGVVIVQGGNVVFANPAFSEMVGVPADELAGRPLRQRIATRDILLVEERLAALEPDAGAEDEIDVRLVDARGEPAADVRLVGRGVDYGGRPAVLVVVRDETAARRADLEFRQNVTRLDAVLEATSDGVLVLTDNPEGGLVRMTNRAFAEMIELPLAELLGAGEDRLLSLLRRRAEGAEAIAAMLASDPARGQKATITLGGASPRELEVTIAALTDRRGRRLGRVLACRDLTPQRRSELQLQRYAERLKLSKAELQKAYERLDAMHGDLEERNQQLDRLNHELKTLNEMKSNLLGNVSHELQTPLVSIRGYTEMILKGRLGPISEEQRKGLELALRNIDRLISMIDNLLSFSREEPELGDLSLQQFPLQPLVREAGEMLGQQIAERRIHFVDEVPQELTVHADRDKILQVLLNLLSNAVKFNKDQGSIHVSARQPDHERIHVVVADSGVGISRDKLERIFERRFQVARDGDPPTQGSGFGLSIVRDILRHHGCRIHAESTEGQGTTFSFTLPAGEVGAKAERAPSGPASAPGEDEDPAGPHLRIIRRPEDS